MPKILETMFDKEPQLHHYRIVTNTENKLDVSVLSRTNYSKCSQTCLWHFSAAICNQHTPT